MIAKFADSAFLEEVKALNAKTEVPKEDEEKK
jgi:hypothetical protein